VHNKFLVLFIYIFTIATTAQAWRGYNLSPAIGTGTNSLNLSVNSKLQYMATNLNFTFISLGIDDFSLQIKFPNPDPVESREARVDSKITDYQFGLKINNHFRALLYHQKYEGYYIESEKIIYQSKNLGFAHTGAQLIYAFNPEFSTAMLEDACWSQDKDRGSWLTSLGVDRFNIKGRLIPEALDPDYYGLKSAEIDSVSLRLGYGYNWLWSHIFAGAAFGVGTNLNKISAEYDAPEGNSNSGSYNSKMISNFSFSGGYRWTETKIGFFARQYNWNLTFDGVEISSNTASTGLYVSSLF
jgi:hypothetical protein